MVNGERRNQSTTCTQPKRLSHIVYSPNLLDSPLTNHVDYRLSKEHKIATSRFYTIDVDAMPEASEELGVRSLPEFYFFQGEQVHMVKGPDHPGLEEAVAKYT